MAFTRHSPLLSAAQFKSKKKYSDRSHKQFYKLSIFCLDNHLLTTTAMFITKKSKKDGKDQETIQSSTTPDPGYNMRN